MRTTVEEGAIKTVSKINVHFMVSKPVRVVIQEEPVCSGRDIHRKIQYNNTTDDKSGGTFLHL